MPSLGLFCFLLADSAPATASNPVALFVLILFFAALGIFFLVFLIHDFGEIKRLREKNKRIHDEWQQTYTDMFINMNNRLNEAQGVSATDNTPTTAAPVPPSPADEYFARISRPRRFLTLN